MPSIRSAPLGSREIFTRSRKWSLAVIAAIYLAGAALVVSQVDPKALHAATSLPLVLLATLLGLSLANYALRAWRWIVLSDSLDIAVPRRDNLLYYLSGYSLTATPGKAGEAIRLWFLKSGHGIAYARSIPLMVADRALDLWAVMLLTVISLSGFSSYLWHGVALLAVVLLMSLPLLRPLTLEPLLLRSLRHARRHARLLVRVRRMVRALARLSSWRAYGLTLIPSVLGWLAEAAALYLLLRHFGSDVSLMHAIFIFSFGMIVGALSMLPGGLGSTEATMVILMRSIGVDLDIAIVSTAIIRATTFWFAVVIGLAVTPLALKAASRAARTQAA